MGGHAHTGQTFAFQEIHFVDQSCHLRGFKQSWLFILGPSEFRESTDKGGKAGFVVLVVEPCSMPSSERRFQRKIEKTSRRASLEAYTPYNFPVGGARLVLEEKVFFEQWEVGRNPQKSFIEVDKDGSLQNGVRVQGVQTHARRKRRTPQSQSYWVWGYLLWWRGATAARPDRGEKNLQQVCEFLLHPQQTSRRSEDEKLPWVVRRSAVAWNESQSTGGDSEELWR
jgi:hypothetical protein